MKNAILVTTLLAIGFLPGVSLAAKAKTTEGVTATITCASGSIVPGQTINLTYVCPEGMTYRNAGDTQDTAVVKNPKSFTVKLGKDIGNVAYVSVPSSVLEVKDINFMVKGGNLGKSQYLMLSYTSEMDGLTVDTPCQPDCGEIGPDPIIFNYVQADAQGQSKISITLESN